MTTYTFYVEEANVSQAELTPTFINFIYLNNGISNDWVINDDSSLPAINEVGGGFYFFDFDPTMYESKTFLIKIDTGNLETRYVTIRIEENDLLTDRISEIKTVADQLKVLADRLDDHVQRLIDIEQGEWRIENNQLLFSHPNDPTDILATFNLYDNNGQPTSNNPFKRSVVSLKNI